MADALPYFSTAFELEQGQDKFWLSTNALVEVLANKLAALLAVTITSADVTLTAGQAENAHYIRVSGAFTANRNLIVPTSAKGWTVEHAGTGSHTLTVKAATGTGVSLVEGTSQQVYFDGTNVIPDGQAVGTGVAPYDQSFSVDGLPGDGAVLYTFGPAVRDWRLPATLAGSKGKINTAATTSSAVLTLKKNGSTIGTLTAAVAASTFTVSFASDVDFLAASDDIFTVIGPSPQNATFGDFSYVFKAVRL